MKYAYRRAKTESMPRDPAGERRSAADHQRHRGLREAIMSKVAIVGCGAMGYGSLKASVHHAKASPSLSERTRFPVDHQLLAIRPACFTPLALRWRDKTRSGRRVSLTAVHREQEAEGEETCGARRDPGMRDRDSFGGAGGQGRA